MEKMRMESVNMTAQNIEKIGALFPNCITETIDENGKAKKAINFELLRQILSDEVIEGNEAYEFTWVGKKASIVEANKPIKKTLRPCKEESVDWDNTENLYIEGDNLDVLKLLQESYLGKVKMIYIDPPYNTGNDFIYQDDFKMSSGEYADESGEFDDQGNRLFKNTDANGRFHSDWCSMMYSRLILARNLLTDDGAIFISIDEHEVETLTKVCDEIFGEINHIGTIVVKSNPRGSMSTSEIASLHEYLLLYSKQRLSVNVIGHELSQEMTAEYKLSDENGSYRLLGLRMRGGFWRRSERPNLYYPIYVNPTTYAISLEKTSEFCEEAFPVQPSTMEDGTWRWSKDKVLADSASLIGKKVSRGTEVVWDIYQKDYLTRGDGRRTKAKSIWDESEINYQNGAIEIKNLFKKSGVFDYSKPTYLIKQAMKMIGFDTGDVVLDFFSGSATTADAVMQLNLADGLNRQFILVQLPEKCNKKSEAVKVGYSTICDIGKERIRRAGDKIKAEIEQENVQLKLGEQPKKVPDVGFRVLKLDDTNMKDVYYAADEYSQIMLDQLESNIKDDRTDLDLLFGCLLEWGLPLSLPYTSESIDGYTVHTYNDGDLIACFEEDVPESVIKEIASRHPLRAVFRDNSFSDSPAKINVGEIFKLMAPDTRVRVI